MRAEQLINRLIESTDHPDRAPAAPSEAGYEPPVLSKPRCPYCRSSAVSRVATGQGGWDEVWYCDACDREFEVTRTHSNDPGTVRKIKDEVAPPGWEPTVKAMKKHGDVSNPWALSWWMKGKGYKSRK